MNDLIIELSGVSVEYILTGERPKTLQDFLINLAKGKPVKRTSFNALKDVTFGVGRGDALGLIGPNGAGKSTLLKVIAGVIKPTAGEVAVRGKIAPIIELGTGFDMELTGAENIYLNASILGLSRKEIDRKFAGIVAFSEIGEFIHSPMRSYSSGMVARLAFSIAVEVEAEILVVDEVLSVGDEGFRKKCREKIDDTIRGGATLLFVSHTMDEVVRLCNSLIWLEHGRIRASGDAGSISRKYLLHFDKTVFADIGEGHPYKRYIEAMFVNGITSGFVVNGSRYYNPGNKISRAEFAVFLSAALGFEKTFAARQVFADVPETHWASRQIAWVYEQGLLEAVRDEKDGYHFFPDDYVTSKDLVDILSKVDAEKCRAVLSGEMPAVNRGEVARIFYEFFGY